MAGSASVLALTSTTGAGSQLLAGGSVGVTAADTTRAARVTGAGAAGGGGGSTGVALVDKDTRAALGADSAASGGGAGRPLTAFDPAGGPLRSLRGVAVQAANTQDLFEVALAGSLGFSGALAGGVTVTTLKAAATAEVGAVRR